MIKNNNIAEDAGIAGNKIDWTQFDTDFVKKGMIRFNETTGAHQYYTGSGWGLLGLSGTTTLDAAYNGGNEIAVDSSAVTLTGTHATNNTLAVTATGGSGNCIDITQGGSGYDIEGTGDTWHVTKAGAIVATDLTLTASTTSITVDATSGNGVYIHGETITTGNALIIEVDKSNMTTGYALNVYENDDAASVFSIADDGATIIAGTATGTAALTLTAGDIAITAGDIDIAEGNITITATANASSFTITNDSATSADVMKINAAGLTTGTALRIDLTEGTLNGGYYLEMYDETGSSAVFTVAEDGVTTIGGAASGTDALVLTAGDITLTSGCVVLTSGDLTVTDSDGSTMSSVNGTTTLLTLDNAGGVIGSDAAVLSIDAGGAVASGGNLLRVAPTGSPNAGAIGIEYVGASKAMTAMYIDGDPTASDVVTINGGGALTSDNAVLCVSSDGALATGGNTFRVDTTGTPASGAIYAEFDFAGITDTNENIGVKIDAGGKKVVGLHVDADPAAGDVVYLHSDAAIASDKAILNITSAGAIKSGGNGLRLDITGTPASGAVYAEFDFAGLTDTNENVGFHIDATSKKVQALKIDAAPVAGSTVLVTSTGVLAADKATAEFVSNVSACNADSAVVRIEQSHTTGVATCLALKQDDIDKPFITFESTIGTGDAIEAVGSKTLTTTHFILVDIEGVGSRYIPVGTIA